MNWFKDINISQEQIFSIIQAAMVLVFGLIVLKILNKSIRRVFSNRLDRQQMMLLRRALNYLVLGLILTWVLHELGFSISIILGAAGILTVALGFASQTSVSNIISGLFLIGEKPFVIGDIIEVDGTTGEVLSIDLLSVKIRTFDNLFVRMPNETMLKAKVTTINKFPIRRLDLKVGVSYQSDTKEVEKILFAVAKQNTLCLEEPKPLFIFSGFGESSLDLQFSVWCKREKLLDLRNSISREIKLAFDENGVEIPFPHRVLEAGSINQFFPAKMVGEDKLGNS